MVDTATAAVICGGVGAARLLRGLTRLIPGPASPQSSTSAMTWSSTDCTSLLISTRSRTPLPMPSAPNEVGASRARPGRPCPWLAATAASTGSTLVTATSGPTCSAPIALTKVQRSPRPRPTWSPAGSSTYRAAGHQRSPPHDGDDHHRGRDRVSGATSSPPARGTGISGPVRGRRVRHLRLPA